MRPGTLSSNSRSPFSREKTSVHKEEVYVRMQYQGQSDMNIKKQQQQITIKDASLSYTAVTRGISLIHL